MAEARFPLMRTLRLTAITRRLALALSAGTAAFALLLIHVFVPLGGLQVAALLLSGLAFLAAWAAVLCWRMPVFSGRTLWAFTLIWCVGFGLAIALVLTSTWSEHVLVWKLASNWLAFSVTLAVGGLQFRALFNRRATPILGRFLSLLSPMIILVLILATSLRG